MNKYFIISFFCLFLISHAVAKTTSLGNLDSADLHSKLYMGIYGGYGNVSGAYKDDGQVTQGRLTLGFNFIKSKTTEFGVELGMESGNTMRLQADAALIDLAGGLPIQSTLKPMLDLLLTINKQLSTAYPLIVILKGGIAYRQLQLENINSTRDGLRKINPECQLGLGVNITKNALLTAFYQGIYSGNTAGVALNSVNDVTISRIPSQQAIFMGIEYSLASS